jgi:hypothetical protein
MRFLRQTVPATQREERLDVRAGLWKPPGKGSRSQIRRKKKNMDHVYIFPCMAGPSSLNGRSEFEYGRPEFLYGRPEFLLYGRPEFVYGRPEFEYGRPEFDVWQARVRISARHPRGGPLLSGSNEEIKSKSVNRQDKLSRRYRDRDLAKFESSRRYRQR